jgi:hypothetical protein
MDKIPPPPSGISSFPDRYTRKSPDFTGPFAENRVFHVSTTWLKYGTDDKGHAASIILSALLLLVAILVGIMCVIGMFSGQDGKSLNALVTWIGNAFLFTAGLAIGKGGKDSKRDQDD